MKSLDQTQRSLSHRHKLRVVGRLLLPGVLLLTLLGWQQPLPVVHSQTAESANRFSFQFQEVAPGIEHGQVTTGQASKDETSGPWLINAVRVDLGQATIKIVRALDAGVGMETVTSLAARHRATAAINGGYFRTTGTYRGESLGLVLLEVFVALKFSLYAGRQSKMAQR